VFSTKVRCKFIDVINSYDVTKTVKNNSASMPYYLTCFVYLTIPCDYKLTARLILPGFRGFSEIVSLFSPIVRTIV